MKKNVGYILKKIDVLKSEMRILEDPEITSVTLTSGPTTKQKALNLKHYQWKIIKFIMDSTVSKLKAKLKQRFKQLCPDCQKGFENQERKCEKDLYTFVYCSMIKKSLVK